MEKILPLVLYTSSFKSSIKNWAPNKKQIKPHLGLLGSGSLMSGLTLLASLELGNLAALLEANGQTLDSWGRHGYPANKEKSINGIKMKINRSDLTLCERTL